MLKLIVIDDDEIICRGIATCIDWQSHGVEVADTAFDGELGLQSIEEHRPDIIIVDINMPFVDGMELSYTVRQNYPHIKIILLTAYKEFAYAQKAVELQVFSYISKPFDNDEVVRAVVDAGKSIGAEKKYRRELCENAAIIRQRHLSELVTGGVWEDGKLRLCGIRSAHSFFTAAYLSVSGIYGPEREEDGLLDGEVAVFMVFSELEAALAEHTDIHYFTRSDGVVLLFEADAPDQTAGLTRTLKTILAVLDKQDDCFLSIGVGATVQGVEAVPHSFAKAQTAVGYRYYFGNRSMIRIDDIEGRPTEDNIDLQRCRHEVAIGAAEGDFERIKANVEALFGHVRSSGGPGTAAVS